MKGWMSKKLAWPSKLISPKRTSNSSSSSVAEPNDGVAVEMLVRGNEELVYYVEGKEVLRYSKPQLDPKSKEAKSLVAKGASLDLSFGHIALQAEGQRVWFRNIKLLPLPSETEPDPGTP